MHAYANKLAAILLALSSLAFAQGVTVLPKTTILPKTTVFPGTAASAPTLINACANGAFSSNPSTTLTMGSGTTCANTTHPTSGDVLAADILAGTGVTAVTISGCVTSWSLVSSDGTTNQYIYIGVASATGSCNVVASGTDASSQQINVSVMDISNAIATARNSAFAQAFCSNCNAPSISANSGDFVIGWIYSSSGTTGTGTAISPYTLGYFTSTQTIVPSTSVYNVPGSTGTIANPAVAVTGNTTSGASVAIEP